MKELDLNPILHQIATQYRLPPNGAHGISHWGRVLENGLRIADAEGGDQIVITLFAIFHDACRHNQSFDPGHGDRAAVLADTLLKDSPLIAPSQLDLLKIACREHTDGKTKADLTVMICWDADRLDLARVGIFPKPQYLCTDAAKENLIISWANDRAENEFVPGFVEREWSPIFV